MNTTNIIKKKCKGTKTKLSSDEIVSKCLQSFTELKPLKDTFVEFIEILEDDFIKEEACKSAISLLKSKTMFLRYMSKIRDLATKPSIPRSLRVNIELTPGQPNVRKTAKFAAIEEEARKDVEIFQKKFKNHFRSIKEADRDDASALHVVNFIRHISKLLDMKACYTFVRIPNNLKMNYCDTGQI